MKLILTLTAFLIMFSCVTAHAGEYEFCLLANKVGKAGKLSEYSNKQIENGLCMTSKEVLDAIVTNNKTKESICTEAATFMMKEFKKRFGNRDPKEVAGRC